MELRWSTDSLPLAVILLFLVIREVRPKRTDSIPEPE